MTEQNTPTIIPAVNMNVDIKKAIISILNNSDNQFSNAMSSSSTNPYGYLKAMDANNDAIRAILNAIG